jgi:hypothetical protein
MHFRTRAALLAVVAAAAVTACSGRSGPLGPQYEYEEDLTLSLDGSGTLVVNASVPALVALHGLQLSTDLRTRADQLKNDIRALYSSPSAQVLRVSNWTRHGRRYVGIRLHVIDIRTLPQALPFAWSKYDLREAGEQVIYKHALARAGPRTMAVPDAGWKGNEIIGFRLHLPARIRFHNSRDFETNVPRQPSRGNILTWEQRMSDRLAGKPIAYAEDHTPDVMEVRMDRQSILYTTLWLFGFAFLAALLVLGGLIWLTMRRGREDTDTRDSETKGRSGQS